MSIDILFILLVRFYIMNISFNLDIVIKAMEFYYGKP